MAPILNYARPLEQSEPLTPAPALTAFLGAPMLILATCFGYQFLPDNPTLIFSLSEFIAATSLFTTILFLARQLRNSQTSEARVVYSLQLVFILLIWLPSFLLLFPPPIARE